MLAGIRADGTSNIAFPEAFYSFQWHDAGGKNSVHLPLRGQRRLDGPLTGLVLLLPVELSGQKGQTSTNTVDFTDVCCNASTISDIFYSLTTPANASEPIRAIGRWAFICTKLMQTPVFDQIAERVDRLLLRHEELVRTNALLKAEVAQLTQERDSLLSRLAAARGRVDALLDRLGDLPNGGASANNPPSEGTVLP